MKRWLLGIAAVLVLAGMAAAITFYRAPLWVSDKVIRAHLRQQGVLSKYVAVDGYRLHYFEAGPRGGDRGALVLVHGLGARGEDWSGMIPALADAGFHVYAPDLLGYGRSPKPDVAYSIGLEEKTVADFMQAVRIGHADVAGWSMGGWIATKLTIDHPELVDRLVLYDSAGVYFAPTFTASLFTPSDGAGLWQLQQMLTPTAKPLPGFVAGAAIRKLRRNGWIIQRSVAAMEGGRDLLDFQLQRIDKPTLVMWGAEDRLIPAAAGKRMHRLIAGSDLVMVEGCGHLAPAECSRAVLGPTLDFLTAAVPPQGVESSVPGH